MFFIEYTFSDKMAEKIKENIVYIKREILPSSIATNSTNTCHVDVQKEIIKKEQKEGNIFIKEEPITLPTVENTCIIYVEEENIKMEPSGIKGKIGSSVNNIKNKVIV